MGSPDMQIANLEVRISMLRKEERRWLTVLTDSSAVGKARNKARGELHKILAEILAAAATVKELESKR